jgi:hypothetical protein
MSTPDPAGSRLAFMYDIYAQSDDHRRRYSLGRTGRKSLYVIGLNPSTATQEKSDPTIAKVEQVAIRTGYDGFVMFNLYPVRATDYNTLSKKAVAGAIARNTQVITTLLETDLLPTIWAAWGTPITRRYFFLQSARTIVEQLKQTRAIWVHFGALTVGGHPRHPSRLAYHWTFSDFDIEAYLSMFDC